MLASVAEIIDEARNGRMFILVDDEDRENEGDLVIPAQMTTPDAINFMAAHGRGLICLAMTKERIDQLGLPPMAAVNGTRHETAFTVSIEARDGVTTGISAADRARTVSVAIDASKGAEDIVSPGHVFPLAARPGGVLVRAGHTEAAVDVARLAGLNPAGVICEILKEDGTMARLDDLIPFAEKHKLKIGTIRDLIAYRRRQDHFVRCVAENKFVSRHGGEWIAKAYVNTISGGEYLVLQKGAIDPAQSTMVRMHTLSFFFDLLDEQDPRSGTLHASMRMIGEAGSGVIVLIFEPVPNGLRDLLQRRESGGGDPLRDYGIGAQILFDLGVSDLILLTNAHRPVVGIEGHGLRIVKELPITG